MKCPKCGKKMDLVTIEDKRFWVHKYPYNLVLMRREYRDSEVCKYSQRAK